VKTVPDKCPFCEWPVRVYGGKSCRSEDGGFATYECWTSQDIEWQDEGQSELCRERQVQLLTKQRDEARERIKQLEEAGDAMAAWLLDPRNLGGGSSMASQWYKAKEAKP